MSGVWQGTSGGQRAPLLYHSLLKKSGGIRHPKANEVLRMISMSSAEGPNPPQPFSPPDRWFEDIFRHPPYQPTHLSLDLAIYPFDLLFIHSFLPPRLSPDTIPDPLKITFIALAKNPKHSPSKKNPIPPSSPIPPHPGSPEIMPSAYTPKTSPFRDV